MNDREFRQQVLDSISGSFCAAKWYNATIWLGSGMTTSCHHPTPHHVSVDAVKANPKALHNTPQKRDDRAKMLAGERPAGCEYCWRIEDMGRDSVSDRVYKSRIYPIHLIRDASKTPVEQDVDLRTLEIAFDRTCQFACSYCNAGFSTTWVKDIKNNGPYIQLKSEGRHHYSHTQPEHQLYSINDENPYVEAFFKWWDSDLHRTLDELRVTGGEPLMSGSTWRLLDWFKNNRGQSTTRLAINSNLGYNVDVDRLLDSIDGIDFDLYTSNESVGAQSEYIRDGLNWNLWLDNMRKLGDSKKLRGLHVMCTINATSLETLPEFLDVCLDFKKRYGKNFFYFTLNILRFPSFQSATVLDDEIKLHYKQRLQNWYTVNRNQLTDIEREHLERLIDYLDVVKTPHKNAAELPVLRSDFKQFYTQYDQRRGKSFVDTFPTLAQWYRNL